jgi:hypothetical protein
MLVEGSSLRSISRIYGVSINTVTKALVDAGDACASFHYENAQGIQSTRVSPAHVVAFFTSPTLGWLPPWPKKYTKGRFFVLPIPGKYQATASLAAKSAVIRSAVGFDPLATANMKKYR